MSRKLVKQFATDIVIADATLGATFAFGTTVPAAASVGYAPGCIFLDIDALAGSQIFINEGTAASSLFNSLMGGGGSLAALLATAAEINRVAQVSTRLVAPAGNATFNTSMEGKTILWNGTITAQNFTLPAATGSGSVFNIVVVGGMSGNKTIAPTGTDKFQGQAELVNATNSTVFGFTAQNSSLITLNGTTRGGLLGDRIILQDTLAGIWQVTIKGTASGSEATPFS